MPPAQTPVTSPPAPRTQQKQVIIAQPGHSIPRYVVPRGPGWLRLLSSGTPIPSPPPAAFPPCRHRTGGLSTTVYSLLSVIFYLP